MVELAPIESVTDERVLGLGPDEQYEVEAEVGEVVGCCPDLVRRVRLDFF